MRVEGFTAGPRCGKALIIGGSLAGLLASRILVDLFDEVIVMERDWLPEGPDARDGLPQGRHTHVLLVRGLNTFEHLFPGIRNELTAAGAETLDGAQDIAWHTAADWGVRFHSRLPVLSCSRPFLDALIRRHVATFPKIRLIEGSEVTGLSLSQDKGHVNGVTWRHRGSSADRDRDDVLAADLVVDASGRTSKTPQYLAKHGYAPPRETVVSARLGYATRLYRRCGALPSGWKGIYLQASPPTITRGGVLLPIEGDRWILGLIGGGGDYPPTDDHGALDFAQSLPQPDIYHVVKAAEPLTPISGYRATENRWRHYEKLSRAPDGLVVLGDAACTFNPVYGQGMTMAAIAALVLQQGLHDQLQRRPAGNLNGFARRFQKALARANSTPWLLATGQDLRFPGAQEGRPRFGITLMHRYVDRLTALSTRDPNVRQRFLEVLHMIKPMGVLFRPDTVFKVLMDRT